MFNYEGLSQRVRAAGYDGAVHDAIVSVAVSVDKFDLTDEQKSVVLDFISSTGREQLEALPQRLLDGEWEDFNYGNVKKGDYVRVKHNAYDSPTGALHNGRVGFLARADARRFVVHYLGEHVGTSMPHPETSLESLRWV
jgi:hypothetical protein